MILRMKIRLFFTCILGVFSSITSNFLRAQTISVDTNYSAEKLVREVFFGNQSSSCITLENISISGNIYTHEVKSFGYFNQNGSNFEMSEGILLSTGNVEDAKGPNDARQSLTENSWGGDADLETAINVQNTYNATVLEFDFTATNSSQVNFEYLFASEQYLRNIDSGSCEYTDGFAFLIKEAGNSDPYRNLAVIPGTNIPIKSNTVRGGGEKCPAINAEYFGHYNHRDSPTNFNGQTKILTAKTEIIPGVKYHLKLVIADQGNGLYDSGVFLKAGSFVGGKDLGTDRLLSVDNALCEGSTLMLDATTSGATYQWFKNGILIPGATEEKYEVNSAGFYEVSIDAGCKLKGAIKVEYAQKPVVLEKSFCNDNNGNPVSVDLPTLNPQIISNYEPNFKVTYYEDPELTKPISNTFTYTNDSTIYVRVESGSCAVISKPVHFGVPKRSLILADKKICPQATTSLTVEDTFSYYKWFDGNSVIKQGSSANIIYNLSVGKYSVELTSNNGCQIVQKVEITASELPTINTIEVTGNTATVSVAGGTPPYQYSFDNSNFQSSNILTNIPRGKQTVYVKDAQNCKTITKEFLILNLINVITPNDDGKNDVLDYSDLSIKKEVQIEIFDRHGNLVFFANKAPYFWGGRMNGRPLATGSFWYILKWIEPDTDLPVLHKGWILVKNRD